MVVKIRISKNERCAFIGLLVFLKLRLLRNEQWIFSKIVKISDFRILSGWIKRYKPALSKLDSSWDNSYHVIIVKVSLAVNVGKFQFFISEENIFFVECMTKHSISTAWNTYFRFPMIFF